MPEVTAWIKGKLELEVALGLQVEEHYERCKVTVSLLISSPGGDTTRGRGSRRERESTHLEEL